MRYRFTAAWANGLIIGGSVMIALGLVLAGLVLFVGLGRTFAGTGTLHPVLIAIVLAGFGLTAGTPLIIAGQLTLIFLDQRRLLASINRRLRVRRPPKDESQPTIAERLGR